jgi:light-independent protochlorophyllide reductase subunit B
VLFDTWVHPLMMGLEEHLLTMFRGDFEFHDEAAPSHLGSKAALPGPQVEAAAVPAEAQPSVAVAGQPIVVPGAVAAWTAEAEKELRKIPFFVRGKARRNTEAYAGERGLPTITVETLYDAKAHFAR